MSDNKPKRGRPKKPAASTARKDYFTSTSGADNIRCPFFVGHNKTDIICEGIIDGSRTRCAFAREDDKSFQQQCYCEREYQRCEIYLSIMHWRWQDDK